MSYISASLMCADLTRLGEEVANIEALGVDWLHFDIMDGHFVPNFTFGPDVIRALVPVTGMPFDVHLMLDEPGRYVEAFVKAGSDILVVHAEACIHLPRVLQEIRDLGARPGVALNPATPLGALDYVLDDVDMVLLMTVNPGFAGQTLVPRTMEKIAHLRKRLDDEGRETILQVDGNVSFENAARMAAAGADCFVAGSSSLFCADMDRKAAYARLRETIAGAER
jgi:ribulose-phosphate 3-epimerase